MKLGKVLNIMVGVMFCVCAVGVIARGEGPSDDNSLENDPNYVQEYQYLSELAEAGEPDSQYRLSLMYWYGQGVEIDESISVEWLEKAAEQEHQRALLRLVNLVDGRYTRELSLAEGMVWWKKLAKCNPGVCYEIGRIYIINSEVGPDCIEARKWIEQSVQMKDRKGIYWKGVLGLFEDDLKQGYDISYKAIKYSAESGDVESQYKMGLIYFLGIGGDGSFNQALFWFKKAADQGYVEAQFHCGYIAFIMKGLITRDEAKSYLLKAYEKGHKEAAYCIGLLYSDFFGLQDGLEIDIDKCIFWYKKAIERNVGIACWTLGDIYYFENESEPNYSEAYKYYLKGAELGDKTSQFKLGRMIYEGLLADIDKGQAYKWIKAAVDGGEIRARYYLGKMYYDGIVVEKDYEKAFKNLYAAATWGSGDKEAGKLVGYMYKNGLGVEKNEQFGEYWIEKCNKN